MIRRAKASPRKPRRESVRQQVYLELRRAIERGTLKPGTHLPDVIPMDIDLPGVAGVDAMKILRADQMTRQFRIIALTAKPMKIDEFLHALDDASNVGAK